MTDFLVLLPLVVIYYLTFAFWLRRPSKEDLEAMRQEEEPVLLPAEAEEQKDKEIIPATNTSINTQPQDKENTDEAIPNESERDPSDQTPLLFDCGHPFL